MLVSLHRLFQFFLVISKQSMNFAVRFVADSVNLRRKLLPRSVRILVEQRLNLVMVLVKQRPDLPLLFRSQLQTFCKVNELLIDRAVWTCCSCSRAVGCCPPIVLSYVRTGHSKHEHSLICKGKTSISHDQQLLS